MRKIVGFTVLVAMLSSAAILMAREHREKRDPNISYRVNVMRSIGSNMGGMGDIFKNGLPLLGNVAGHARNIEVSGRMIKSAFQKKVMDKKSTAKPDIWQDYAKFEKAADNLVVAAGKLASAAEGQDQAAIMGGLKKLGGACKDCHKQFRKKKKRK